VRFLQLSLITIHVLAAAAWFGAMVFFAAVLVPALRRREASERRELIAATGERLRTVFWAVFVLLIVTGAAQLWLRGYRWADVLGPMWQGSGGHALGLKLILFAVAAGTAAIHDFAIGPSAVAPGMDEARRERRRRLASYAGRASLLLAAAIIACAVVFARGGLRP
jgi:putative copper export protein